MILDITYSNIRVFREPSVFSMEASDSLEKSENIMTAVIGDDTVNILKVGAVYGPNASGKTTLISVLYVLRAWLLNSPYNYFSDYLAPFKLDDYSEQRQSSIRIRFILGDQLLRYSVGFLQGKCVEERLEKEVDDDGRYELLFERIVPKTGLHSIRYGNRDLDAPILEVPQDKSILALFNNITVTLFSDVARYLSSIEIANSYNTVMLENMFNQVRPWLKKNGNTRRLVDFINCFDININNVKIPQKPESTQKDIKYVHSVRNIEGDVVKDSDFRSDLESSGTRVLTILGAKVMQALDEGRPLLVDELDSGFHTEVTRTIIDMFRDPEINRHNAQLIMTTHNVKLMDEHTLRKDQVWFIQKNESGQSELFSLAEFDEVDEYDNYSQWYLARRFGAIPNPNLLKIRRLFYSDHS